MTEAPGPCPPRRLVVGCGYLGSRVASAWRERGDAVWTTTRSPARAEAAGAAGYRPLVVDLCGPAPLPEFPAVDTVVWAVSPDTAGGHHPLHVAGLRRLLDVLPGTPRILFISSTGVYGGSSGAIVDESTVPAPDRPAGRALLEAEAILSGRCPRHAVILRLAGIYGPGRLPRLDDLRAGRPLAGAPDTWLNLIHVADAAAIVAAVGDHPSPGPLYLVSDGHPVRRRDWYAALAEAIGAPEPRWAPDSTPPRGGDKRVDPGRLFRDVGPRLLHADAFTGLRASLEAR